MKITIIGAGAMGCLFAGMLSGSGQVVRLLAKEKEQAERINNRGIIIASSTGRRLVRVEATAAPDEIKDTDIAILFVKHSQTKAAAETAARIVGNSGYILTLQNGMGNGEIIAGFIDEQRILIGTTAHGAMLLGGQAVVQHSGTGETVIGSFSLCGDSRAMSTAKRVVALFLESGIESRVAENIKPVLWHKLFVNVGINAVTALTGIRNGQLLDSEHSRQLVAAAVGEAVAVARMLDIGIDKKKDTIIEQVFAVAVATASNRSSMGQDLDRHSPTEIDAINGYIVRRAEELNIPVPVNRTLTGLIKVKEKSWEEEERNHFVPDK